ncbi:MAG: tetratricopeptide repeat protein [Acidobacteria bacterium]|nr:tetratricopeptide repeat protein [Acidobacteriota bacterium]
MIRVAIILCVGWALAMGATSGVALYQARRFPEAEQVLRAALRKQPLDQQARLLLARTLVELNRVPEALSELQRLMEARPSPELEMEAGRLLRRLAERRFSDLSRQDDGQAAVSEIAGRRLEREGNFTGALARYQETQAREPERPGIHYALGSVHWKLREMVAAEAHLRAELARTPGHGMANFRLGQVLIATGREQEAVAPLERAAGGMPERPEVRRELGKGYRKVGRTADARRVWESVALERPNDDQIHFLLGGIYRETGERDLAQREFDLHRKLLEERRRLSERH